MKIKTFAFTICRNIYENKTHSKMLLSPEQIDAAINKFIFDVDVVDIKVNTYESRCHNNGGFNEVQIVYTILYKEL